MTFITSRTKEVLNNILDEAAETNSIHIITLEGNYAAGKDVYAKMLKALYNQRRIPNKLFGYNSACILRFADPLREDFKKAGIDNLDYLKRTNLVFPEDTAIGGYDVYDLTVREAMIHIAESNKLLAGDYYAEKLLKILDNKSLSTGADTFIIPDLRFEVERKAIQNEIENRDATWTKIYVSMTDSKMPEYDYLLPSLEYLEI